MDSTKGYIFRRLMHQLQLLAIIGTLGFIYVLIQAHYLSTSTIRLPIHAAATVERCRQLTAQAGSSLDFYRRSQSDRFVLGTRPVLVKYGRIWTGDKNGTHVIRGDILMDKVIIKRIGHLGGATLKAYGSNLDIVDAKGAWVTPSIVDIHSHVGDSSSPALDGAADDNSFKFTIMPWLRSLDGLNTHDDSYFLSVSGGVTTSLVLPGSANAIACVIKLRDTADRTPSSMLLEPPYQINNSFPTGNLPLRWRHVNTPVANPSGIHGVTQMDTNWAFREAYNQARKIKERQDEYCAKATAGNWEGFDKFPDDLQWEALADVLRGRAKVHVNCYEAVDLDSIVRLSNEFKFPIAAFHHAHEAYLVPDLLRKAYGKTPALALFATFARYKREAYRGPELASRILAQQGLTVLMKSDHPVINSHYLLHEAQQAYFYGFPENLALLSVTSNSAEVMGMGHRIGYIKEGWDADLVIWDSHPLALGATPTQVFIDGLPQLQNPHVVQKPTSFQHSPKVPNFDKEAQETVDYEGLPPLTAKKELLGITVFTNVKSIYQRDLGTIKRTFAAHDASTFGVVVTRNGSVICTGTKANCMVPSIIGSDKYAVLDLEGGSIAPGLVSFGSPLGLQNIRPEDSTNDGRVFDPLEETVPKILGGDTAVPRAVDGLQFESREALLAYRSGVTSGITAPIHSGFYAGLSTAFSLGVSHKLEKGAVIQEVTGIHVSIKYSSNLSVSSQIAALRCLLLGPEEGATGHWFGKVKGGQIPLVVEAYSADVIATLVNLKQEVERSTKRNMRLTITGGAEAHLLAKELGEAGIGVVLRPSRPFPLPGPPITKITAVEKLLENNVVVGIGCEEIWFARNLPLDLAWVAIDAGGRISTEEASAIGSTNLESLLSNSNGKGDTTMVAIRGGDLGAAGSKAVAIISSERQLVHIIE